MNEYTKVAEQFYVRYGRVTPSGVVAPFTRELSLLIQLQVDLALARAAKSARDMDMPEYP
jgi:hypothetical protein